jgi:hypothetical protein
VYREINQNKELTRLAQGVIDKFFEIAGVVGDIIKRTNY